MSDARENILRRIEQALADGREAGWVTMPASAAPVPPDIPESLVREVPADSRDALWARFVERLAATGDTAHRFADPAGARAWLAEYLRENNLTNGVIDPDAAWTLGVQSKLGGARLESGANRESVFAADFGVTLADYGIAETATIAIASGPGRARLASLAPMTHFAVLDLNMLVPDLIDAIPRLMAASGNPAMQSYITGSSRTGDIDGLIIRGVHGPGKLFVLGLG